jgi:hypothetical protein
MELRGDNYGAQYGGLHCPACGVGLREGERCSIPGCPEARRAARRHPARNLTGAEAMRRLASGIADGPGGTLDGAEALRQTEAMRFNDGQWALDYLDRMDELERRSMDLELLDAYEAAQRWPAIHQGPS